MRAAKAAKDLQEVINSLCTCLEESITAAALADHNDNGGQYIRAHLIPLLRNICKEVCDTLPAHPSAHIAVWLLERCRASDELQKEGRTWLTTPSPFVNPWRDDAPMSPTGKKPKNGRPERREKRAMTAEVSFTAGAAMKASSSLSPADLEADEACAFASERGDEGEENMPIIKVSSILSCTDATDFLRIGSQKSEEPMGRTASKIWKCAKADEDGAISDAGDGPEDPDEELHIGLDIFKPRKAKEAIRGSVCDPAVLEGKRRRYTQIIRTVELELPDEEECLELLRPVKAFEGIDDEGLKLVVAKTKCRAFQPDENIVPYNSISDELHIVVTGTASVSVPHKIGDLHRGDMFGNHLLMPTNTPCMQQIQAFSAPVTTLSISSGDFETLGLKAHYMAKCTKDRMARGGPDEADHSSKGRGSIKSSPYEVVQGYEQSKNDRDMIQRAVKSNKVLGEVLSLSEQQAEMMSDYMRLVFFAMGDMVIMKGDRGDALYIVQQGYLDCTVDDNLEGEFRIREGDAFGELGLLYDAPRTATIRACCDCRLWVLHRYEFQIVMSMNYCARAAEYAGMLSKIPYMNSLIDPDRMDIVAGVVEEISLMETEELCIEGEDKGFLFLIYYGQCEATQDGEFKRFLNKGDWVGEEQLKDTIAATETVKVCSESAIVVAIDRPTLRMAFDTIKDIEQRGGATSSSNLARRVSDHLDGTGPPDQSAYNDHLTKKKVTNGILQKRLVKAVGRHKHDKDEPEWELSKVEFLGGLGEGSFGKVYLVKHPVTDVLAAVKVMSKEHIIRDNLGAMVQAERKIMMLFESKFVVRLFASFQDSQSIMLLLEAALGGELFDIYSDHSLYGDLNVVRFHIACVTMGLEHMHSLRVIYRDLKLENCLIDTKGYVKLADMGIAKVAIGKSYTVCGTADYFAPETLKQHGHNRAVDWWAMGVLLFIMCSGRSPFDAPEVAQIYKNIIKGFSKVKFPGKFPSDLIDVIKSLCRSKPEERVTMQKGGVENLKEMPFFSKIDWDALAEQTMEAPYKPEVDFDAIRRKKLSPLDLTNVMPWDGSIDMMEQAASPSAPEIPARGG